MKTPTKLNSILYLLLRATWVLVGGCVGAVLTILVGSNSELLLNQSLFWGVAIGIGLSILAVFFLVLLRPREFESEELQEAQDQTDEKVSISPIADKFGLTEQQAEKLISLSKHNAKSLLSLVVRLWSGAAALGMAVAIAGSVIAMVTAVAAIRQVNRIDFQNALLKTQNDLLRSELEEAKITRASELFSAQLPTLLEAIEKERSGEQDFWVPSAALISRIQAFIDTSEPIFRDPEVDAAIIALNEQISDKQRKIDEEFNQGARDFRHELPVISEMRFSPQRAQLFRILVSVKVDFSKINPPLDFSRSDFRNLNFRNLETGKVDLGSTVFTYSNFLDGDLSGFNFSKAKLANSVLSDTNTISTDLFSLLHALTEPEGILHFDWTENNTDILAGALLLRQRDADVMRAYGWLGNYLIGEPGPKPRYPEDISHFAVAAEKEPALLPGLVDRPAAFARVLTAARVNGQPVFQLGLLDPFSDLVTHLVRMDLLLRDSFEDCSSLDQNYLDELSKLVWFAEQEKSHLKWSILANIALGFVTEEVRHCIEDGVARIQVKPNIAMEYMIK